MEEGDGDEDGKRCDNLKYFCSIADSSETNSGPRCDAMDGWSEEKRL
jgi:hypothetical protein